MAYQPKVDLVLQPRRRGGGTGARQPSGPRPARAAIVSAGSAGCRAEQAHRVRHQEGLPRLGGDDERRTKPASCGQRAGPGPDRSLPREARARAPPAQSEMAGPHHRGHRGRGGSGVRGGLRGRGPAPNLQRHIGDRRFRLRLFVLRPAEAVSVQRDQARQELRAELRDRSAERQHLPEHRRSRARDGRDLRGGRDRDRDRLERAHPARLQSRPRLPLRPSDERRKAHRADRRSAAE